MIKTVVTLTISALILSGALSSCAVGPDFVRPQAPTSTTYAPQPMPVATASANVFGGESQQFNPTSDVPFDWWTLFQSPAINTLIEKAFQTNPDIESAQAALKQAQEYAEAQHGFFYPTISAGYMASRNKIAGNMSSSAAPGLQGNGDILQSGPAKPTYYNFHTAQLTVGYSPDVFGLNRRQVESAEALVSLQQLQLEAAYISLASNVFAAAIQEATLRAEIMTMERVVNTQQEQLDILLQQFRVGYVSGMEVAQQQSALALSQQSLIPLRNQLQQTRDLLRALAGNFPDQDIEETFELTALHLPKELPLSLPSTLVEQRPDVRAAEAQLHYASAQAGVAIANTLPQFEVTAAAGGMADSSNWMFHHGGGFFDLAASVSQIIFDGGTLRAQSRAAQQALNQAAAQYRSTVIVALQNMADTLYTLQADAETLKAAAASEQAAENAMNITRKQYELGYVNYQTQLTAEQSYEMAVINLVQAQANRFADTAALYQALGGGWWNRTETKTASNTATTELPAPASDKKPTITNPSSSETDLIP